ncbi:putative zinc finger protein [Tothia fuscella]|uniref:Zinc finger protein n=1 Tax=Tothia fuscella TaxID=1048955 RepID=A0A9P4NX81_9PEZI|nr:putative zinc finger protein [Tothia fuscella]
MSYECETCTKCFGSQHAADQHMEAVEHWPYKCEACDFTYATPQAARVHMDNKNHWRVHFCHPCGKGFQNDNNYRMHMNSRIHQSMGVPCPYCQANYATASAVVNHLESNKCPNAVNVNRETIHRFLQQHDISGSVVKKLLTFRDERPSDNSASTQRAWNGSGYEYYLCHRTFNKAASLGQHLSSAAHQQKIYNCPSPTCQRDFISLTGLSQHFESESCGYTRFADVQRAVGNLISGGRSSQRLLGFQ